jgi:Nucleotidyl transferase AbiEii toxin, Type IV TA system
VNSSFERFLRLPKEDRIDVFATAAQRLDTTHTYVEKDFWVCLILDLLYNDRPAGHPRLLFKGGTSLSKAFGLIKRFSEDIDIVVSREDLKFTGDRDPTSPSAILSGRKREALFADLRAACSGYICGDLGDSLKQALGAVDPTCAVQIDPVDKDRQTLLVEYQSLFDVEEMSYVSPRVKIEGGARSGLDPHTTRAIAPFVAEDLSNWDFRVGGIVTLDPARTFWEKLLILHGCHCGYRDKGHVPADGNRLSRHYYDVAMISDTDTGRAALSDQDIAAAVRGHNQVAFRQPSKKFEEAVPGSLRIVPQPALQATVGRDYTAMSGMILGTPPPFAWIMARLTSVEAAFNGS